MQLGAASCAIMEQSNGENAGNSSTIEFKNAANIIGNIENNLTAKVTNKMTDANFDTLLDSITEDIDNSMENLKPGHTDGDSEFSFGVNELLGHNVVT